MEPQNENDRTPSRQPPPAEAPPPAPKKRFRIEKLDERIAPRRKGVQGSNDVCPCPIGSAY
jgi:hypothetical protein